MNQAAIIICLVTLAFTLLSAWLTRRALRKPADEYALTLQPAAWEREGGTDLAAPVIPPASGSPDDATGATLTAPAGARMRPAGAGDAVGSPQLLEEVVSGLAKIPPLPQSLHQILRELDAAGSSARSVADILSSDPVIGATLLRIVNSAAFSLKRRILTLHDAVAFLGFSTVRAIVLRLNVASLLPHPGARAPCYDTAALWVHSTAVAAVADLLARRISRNPDLYTDPALASTLGLLHDIGKLAINSQFPEKVAELWSGVAPSPDESLLARERRLFGADHAFAGAFLAARWKLPDELAEAIRLHHLCCVEAVQSLAPPLRRAVVIVHVANQLVKYAHIYCEDMEIDIVSPELLALLGLPTSLEHLLDDEMRKVIEQASAIARELGIAPTRPRRLSA